MSEPERKPPGGRDLARLKTVIFSLTPLVLIYCLSETVLSGFNLAPFVPLPEVTPPVRARMVSPWGDERDVLERIFLGEPTTFEVPNFRAFLPPLAKKPGVLRISFVGDSFVFGTGVSDHQTLPFCLSAYLRYFQPDLAVEVVNLGSPGADTGHYLRLAPLAAQYHPDLVLLGFTMSNDGEIQPAADPNAPKEAASGDAKTGVTRAEQVTGYVRSFRDALLSHSRTFSLLYRPIRRLEARARQDRFMKLTYDDPPSWASVERNITAFAAHFSSLHVPVAMLVFPHTFPSRYVGLNSVAGYPYRDYHKRVVLLGQSVGFEVIDVLGYFEEEGITSFDAYIVDGDGHPNSLYYGPVARHLALHLLTRHALGKPPVTHARAGD